jgi:hypothetical protein
MDVLAQIEELTHATYATLILPEDFNCQNASYIAQVWILLQAAAEQVDSAGQSLKLIRCEEKEIISHKEAIIALLKHIGIVRGHLSISLPPLSSPTLCLFICIPSPHLYTISRDHR